MSADDVKRTRWLGACCGLAFGLFGCSQQSGSVRLDPPVPPTPAPPMLAPEQAVQHVKDSPAADGDTYSVWVEKQIARDGRRVVFCDWSAQKSTVRFTYVLRDPDYRTTTHAFEWLVTNLDSTATSPRQIDLASKGTTP